MSPESVTDQVFDAIRDDVFYILTDPERNPGIQARLEGILQGHKPPDLQLG